MCTKKCLACELVLSTKEFDYNKKNIDGYRHVCRDCNKACTHIDKKKRVKQLDEIFDPWGDDYAYLHKVDYGDGNIAYYEVEDDDIWYNDY